MKVLAARIKDKQPRERRGQGSRHAAQEPDRHRRPQRPHPHLQLPAGPRDRPPHQPDALQARHDHGRRSGRPAGGAAGGTGGAAAGRTRRARGMTRPPTPGALRAAAAAAGVDRLDAQLLLAEVLGAVAHLAVRPRRRHRAARAPAARFQDWATRRAAGEPFAYLVGRKEFHGPAARRVPAVLVPRPDTETLVAWALELPPRDARPRRVAGPGHRQRRHRAGAQAQRGRRSHHGHRRQPGRPRRGPRQRHPPRARRRVPGRPVVDPRWPGAASTSSPATRPTSPATTTTWRPSPTSPASR